MALENCSPFSPPPHRSWTSVSEFRLKAVWMSQITKTLKPNFLKPTRAVFHVIRIHLLAQGPRQGHPRPRLPQRTLFESFKEILFLPKQIGKEWDPAVRAADQVFVKLFNKSTVVQRVWNKSLSALGTRSTLRIQGRLHPRTQDTEDQSGNPLPVDPWLQEAGALISPR